jgi:branched-chain amino acid transport system substrate-binding protein
MYRRLLSLLALVALFALPACGGDEEAVPLRMALLAPLEGEMAPVGQSLRNGVVLAVEEWNERGGVLGRPVQVVVHESGCDAEVAGEAARAAISEEGIRFIVGGACAMAAEELAEVASTQGALYVSPLSTYPNLTLNERGTVRSLVFRVPSLDSLQGEVAAAFALEVLEAEAVVILTAEGSAYGRALADAFEEVFTAGEGEVLLRTTYDGEAEAYFDLLEEVREAEPDLLYVPGYWDVANRLGQQARSFGVNALLLGSDGWHSPNLDGLALNGAYLTAHFSPEEPREVVRNWNQSYRARYGSRPDVVAALGYDGANLLLTALAEAGQADPVLVARALESITFEGISGTIAYDEFHNPHKSVPVLWAAPGRFVHELRMDPPPAVEGVEGEEPAEEPAEE